MMRSKIIRRRRDARSRRHRNFSRFGTGQFEWASLLFGRRSYTQSDGIASVDYGVWSYLFTRFKWDDRFAIPFELVFALFSFGKVAKPWMICRSRFPSLPLSIYLCWWHKTKGHNVETIGYSQSHKSDSQTGTDIGVFAQQWKLINGNNQPFSGDHTHVVIFIKVVSFFIVVTIVVHERWTRKTTRSTLC